jgi:hypothetical protein
VRRASSSIGSDPPAADRSPSCFNSARRRALAFFGAAGDSSVQDELRSVHNEIFGVSSPDSLDIRAGDGRADITLMNVIGFDAFESQYCDTQFS